MSIQGGVACRLFFVFFVFFVFFCYACCSFVITLYRANRQFDIRLLRREKNTSITSCNSLSTFANTIGASRRFVLAERLRGSDTGSVQSEERFGRNPCRKTRFAGALWLTQGEIADLQSGLAQRRSPRNRPGGRAAMLRFEAER